MTKSESNLSHKEFSLLLGESSDFDQMSEELTTLDEVHHEINSEFVLENILHINQELVLNGVQNLLLQLDILNLLVLDNDIFTDTLHGVEFVSFSILNKEHFSESTLTEHLTDLEVFQLRIILSLVENVSTTSGHTHSGLTVNFIEAFICKISGVIVSSVLLSTNLNLLVQIYFRFLGAHLAWFSITNIFSFYEVFILKLHLNRRES